MRKFFKRLERRIAAPRKHPELVRLRSLDEYLQHKDEIAEERAVHEAYLTGITPKNRTPFTVRGYSYPAQKSVNFRVDFDHSTQKSPNWREWMICPKTRLNNRMRAAMHFLDIELSPTASSEIYITEAVTPLFIQMQKRYPKLVGSEYLGNTIPRGETNQEGVRNEDMTQYSFRNETFEYVLSFECLEHIPDYIAAFSEFERILKPGGTLVWTAPFLSETDQTLVRAKLDRNGAIEHLLEPEYHGDPINNEGCLCFYHFGWDILKVARDAGFEDVYMSAFSSNDYGYLGEEQMIFVAKKAGQER